MNWGRGAWRTEDAALSVADGTEGSLPAYKIQAATIRDDDNYKKLTFPPSPPWVYKWNTV